MSQDEDIAYGHIVQRQLDEDWQAAEDQAAEESSDGVWGIDYV